MAPYLIWKGIQTASWLVTLSLSRIASNNGRRIHGAATGSQT
jgi:hypothetical protein